MAALVVEPHILAANTLANPHGLVTLPFGGIGHLDFCSNSGPAFRISVHVCDDSERCMLTPLIYTDRVNERALFQSEASFPHDVSHCHVNCRNLGHFLAHSSPGRKIRIAFLTDSAVTNLQ